MCAMLLLCGYYSTERRDGRHGVTRIGLLFTKHEALDRIGNWSWGYPLMWARSFKFQQTHCRFLMSSGLSVYRNWFCVCPSDCPQWFAIFCSGFFSIIDRLHLPCRANVSGICVPRESRALSPACRRTSRSWRIAPDSHRPKYQIQSHRCPVDRRTPCRWRKVRRPLWVSRRVRRCSGIYEAERTKGKSNFIWLIDTRQHWTRDKHWGGCATSGIAPEQTFRSQPPNIFTHLFWVAQSFLSPPVIFFFFWLLSTACHKILEATFYLVQHFHCSPASKVPLFLSSKGYLFHTFHLLSQWRIWL